MNEATETSKPAVVAGRIDGLVRRLRQHALPDPHDEREVLHAPLLGEAADELERLWAAMVTAHRDFEAMKNGCGIDYLMKAAASARNVVTPNAK